MVELRKNKKKPNYTSKTLQHFKQRGIRVDVAEKVIPRVNRRKDLFGIIDIIALTKEGVLGIQSTGPNGFSSHYKAMVGEKREAVIDWFFTPGTILELWAWRKLKGRWVPRIHRFTFNDLFNERR